jgi:hypothetical protein
MSTQKKILTLLVLTILLADLGRPTASAQAGPQHQDSAPNPVFIQPVRSGISLPLNQSSSLAMSTQAEAEEQQFQVPLLPNVPGLSMPVPTASWEGISNANNITIYGSGALAPNVSGDVGPGHYIQAVNNLFQVWNLNGLALTTPHKISSLFTNLGGMCATHNDGNPVVVYDHLADRWVLSQFATDSTPPVFEFHQCVAVSSSPDPVGGTWYLYDYLVSTTKFNDDPKLAVWNNGYYLTFNQFKYNGFSWIAGGQGVAVLEREKMLSGRSAGMVYVDLESTNPDLNRMLPADLDGAPPPSDTPGYFVQFDDNAPTDQLQIWTLEVHWDTDIAAWGEASPGQLAVSAFDSNLCSYSSDCIPQPGAPSDARLNALSDRLMYRLQYRYLNGFGNMVVNHTVDVGSDHAGIRWYHLQVDNLSGLWEVANQGTYAPDANHRWMGSAAMDASGNIAVGYSVSSATVNPSIRYAGRLSTDPAGQLSQGEVTVVNGGGIQTNTASQWGEYSMMAVDPVDQCTFWYTAEYIAATNEGANTSPWRTKIAKFNFGPGTCSKPATYTISGYVIDSNGGPLAGATVFTDNGYFATTSADGIYTLNGLPAGTYILTAGKLGWKSSAPHAQSVPPDASDVYLELPPQNKIFLSLVMRH